MDIVGDIAGDICYSLLLKMAHLSLIYLVRSVSLPEGTMISGGPSNAIKHPPNHHIWVVYHCFTHITHDDTTISHAIAMIYYWHWFTHINHGFLMVCPFAERNCLTPEMQWEDHRQIIATAPGPFNENSPWSSSSSEMLKENAGIHGFYSRDQV